MNTTTMDKCARNLINNTIRLRNWLVLSNYTTKAFSNVQDTLSDDKLIDQKEHITKFIAMNTDDCTNIWKSIQETYAIRDGRDAIIVMNVLTQKVKNKEVHCKNLKDSKEFLQICRLIEKDAKSLNNHSILQALSMLILFEVPINSRVIQILLQLIRATINKLTVLQIIILYNSLYQQKQLPLIKSLLDALPIAFKIQAKVELDSGNKNLLLKSLSFAVKINDTETLNDIIGILSKVEQDTSCITTVYNALNVLPKLNTSSLALLRKVEQVINDDPELLKFNTIYFVIHIISQAVKRGQMNFYREDIIDILCDTAINNNITFAQGIGILSNLNAIQFSNTSLLNYLAEKYVMDTHTSMNCTCFDIYILLKGFVTANHIPPYWKKLQEMVLNYLNNSHYPFEHLASLTYHLISLGCYCPELLNRTFSMCNSNFNAKHEKYRNTVLNCIPLHYYTKTLYPEYTGTVLNESIVNSIITEQNTKFNYDKLSDLTSCLQKVLGGDIYTKSGLRTTLGHSIDCVIAIQPNGLPVPLNENDNVQFIEHLITPPGCQILLILFFPKKAYSINLQTLQSTWMMQLKSLQVYTEQATVVINPYAWYQFSEYEKIAELRKAIEYKLSLHIKY